MRPHKKTYNTQHTHSLQLIMNSTLLVLLLSSLLGTVLKSVDYDKERHEKGHHSPDKPSRDKTVTRILFHSVHEGPNDGETLVPGHSGVNRSGDHHEHPCQESTDETTHVCGLSFNDFPFAEVHEFEHHEKESGEGQCDECKDLCYSCTRTVLVTFSVLVELSRDSQRRAVVFEESDETLGSLSHTQNHPTVRGKSSNDHDPEHDVGKHEHVNRTKVIEAASARESVCGVGVLVLLDLRGRESVLFEIFKMASNAGNM